MLSGHTPYTPYTIHHRRLARRRVFPDPPDPHNEECSTKRLQCICSKSLSYDSRTVRTCSNTVQFEHCAARTLCCHSSATLAILGSVLFLELFYCSIDTLLPRWLTVTLGPYHCTQCCSNGTSSAARSRSSKNFGKRRGSPRTFFAKFEQFFEQTKFELLQTAAQFAILIEREHDRWSVVVCGEDWWRI